MNNTYAAWFNKVKLRINVWFWGDMLYLHQLGLSSFSVENLSSSRICCPYCFLPDAEVSWIRNAFRKFRCSSLWARHQSWSLLGMGIVRILSILMLLTDTLIDTTLHNVMANGFQVYLNQRDFTVVKGCEFFTITLATVLWHSAVFLCCFSSSADGGWARLLLCADEAAAVYGIIKEDELEVLKTNANRVLS